MALRYRAWAQRLGQEDPLEEDMATHSDILAWRIPGTGKPGGLPPMGSHRVGHAREVPCSALKGQAPRRAVCGTRGSLRTQGSATSSSIWREDPGLLSRPCRKRRPSAREDGGPRHAHGDLTSLAPHERLPEILVVPREKTPTGAAARAGTGSPALGLCSP